MCIEKPDQADYPGLVDIWARAVKATHHFLPDEYFRRIHAAMPLVYLPNVDLYVIRAESGEYGAGRSARGADDAGAEAVSEGAEGDRSIMGFIGLAHPAEGGLSGAASDMGGESASTGASDGSGGPPVKEDAGDRSACGDKADAGSRAPASCVEMLFVDPDLHRRGAGRALLDYARERFGRLELEVNEQNPGAREFYERYGFKTVGRSELDGSGEPYPLLHMRLEG